MKNIKFFLAAMVIAIAGLMAPVTATAQNNESEQITETINIEKKSDSKKSKDRKEKDLIEINDSFLISLAINTAAILILILLIYYPNYRKPDYIFTFVLFNIIIFLLTFVLNEVKISMGAAFGLFAVFSMLRYRTAGISMKDMTYLFIFIGIGLISAIQLEYSELGIILGIIIIFTFIMDGNIFFRREFSKSIQYERIELIKPEYEAELIEDLRKRTGLKIHRISVGGIDFLKDTAKIKVYYHV